MTDSTASPRRIRVFALAVLAVAEAAAATVAWGQVLCPGTVVTPGTAPVTTAPQPPAEGSKFRLIEQQCPQVAQPATAPRPAAQLSLYDRPALAVRSPEILLEPEADPAAGSAMAVALPPGPVEQRILAIAPALSAVAREADLDPLLMHAIAHVESRHNPAAVSRAGARGVMQVMPTTGSRFGVMQPERNLLDPHTNLRAAAALLRTLMDRYGANLPLVLAAYNAGEGAVAKHGNAVPPYPETRAYVRDVLAIYQRLGSHFSVSRSGALVAKGTQP